MKVTGVFGVKLDGAVVSDTANVIGEIVMSADAVRRAPLALVALTLTV